MCCFAIVQEIRDAPDLQQQQQPQPGDDDDDADIDAEAPQYAELAPSTRRSERSRIVDNSTAVYAIIIHPKRT